jgi:hypothetical protein
MSSQGGSHLLEPKSGAWLMPVVSRFKDCGDRLCCAALIAIAIVLLAAIGRYVWHMPPLR